MNIDSIEGGVSPLKARQSSRGGKRAGSATATSKRRGGFAASKGKRGGGGRNVGGYNVNTRFKADKWVKPPSGGTMTTPKPNLPFNHTPDGTVKINDPTNINVDANASADASATGVNTTTNTTDGYWKEWDETTGGGRAFQVVWDENKKDFQKKMER